MLPAEVRHPSFTRGSELVAAYGGFQVLLVDLFPMVGLFASPPGFLLPRGQVVPHVGLQVLHVHIVAAQNQNQWPQKRVFIHGRPPRHLLAGGMPLDGT